MLHAAAKPICATVTTVDAPGPTPIEVGGGMESVELAIANSTYFFVLNES